MRIALWFGCLTLLILALARPTHGVKFEVQRNLGNRIIFIVDTSKSMDVRDMSTSRMERLKIDLYTLIQQFPGNEYAIVSFAQEPFLYMPFTYDVTAAEVFINALTTDMITNQGTDLGAAIELSLGLTNDRPDIPTALLLLTDGEDHEPLAISMAQIAAERNMTIHVLGYGTTSGGPIPLYDISGNLVGYKSLSDGTLVNSARNDGLLRQIANSSGGNYVPMDQTGSLASVTVLLENLVSGELSERVVQRPQSIAFLFISGAMILLSAEIILSNRRQRIV